LHEIGKIGDMLGYNVYVVGGFVRDLLLKKENFDIDIVVEGDGIHFAKEFTDKIGGTCKLHHRFKTAVITFPDGFKIDIATARKEQYEHPAALPKIETSAIVEDLFRRDFTINAMAIQINESSYGNLVDFFGGEQDIKDKSIKVLHTKSFIDDPTRIFRAVRFETRLGFKIHPLTKELILEALVNEPLFERLANQRVRDELILILNDENPQIAIQRLSELGVLKYIHPTITITKGLLELFKKVTEGFFYFEVIINQQKVERWLSYFIALVDNLKVKHVEEIATHLKFTNIQRNKLINGKKTADRVVNYLRLKPELNPSDVYKLLNKIPIEVLIFIVAKSEAVFQTGLSCKIKKAVADYLSYMREEKVLITGDDLKQLGLPPGPMYKDIIMDVLYARLDKKVITKEDEIAWVKQKWQDKINKQIDH
jgi:tRNA nucleotidyltransferase (CCA-adding enzyme)